ncbi:MAG: hypothetical protein M0Z36_03620 [Thermaerobacter sp.]|nr:hypothetical protein [Thermaerobacter sp.]
MISHKSQLIAVLALAAMPCIASANGARVQVGGLQDHVSFGGGTANLSGAFLGISGVSRRLGGIGIRARLGYADGFGASLETLGVRVVGSPHQRISPYASLGVLDLSSLAVPPTTSYVFNLVMGDVFAGLRGRYVVNPRLSLMAHAAMGEGVGGSVTGLAPQSGTGSVLATSFGVAMRYRVTNRLSAGVSYTQESIPARGSTFKNDGIEARVSYLFN